MSLTASEQLPRASRRSRPTVGRCAAAALVLGALFAAFPAEAGISSILAHGATFRASDTIPVFVDPGEASSITVKGQFMDLCTGVESTDASFSVRIGRRVHGSSSSVEILVGAGDAPSGDESTIKVKFAVGEESFRVRAHKVVVNRIALMGKTENACTVGESVVVAALGEGMRNLDKGLSGTMLDVADGRYELGPRLGTNTETMSQFAVRCTAEGSFTVKRTWFRDASLPNPQADAMVRGSGTLTVTVRKADPTLRKPVK